MSIIDICMPMGFECGFQNNTDFHSKKYCFKYEYADNGRRCLVVGDDKEEFIRWFHKLPESQRKLYELIRETDIVAEYYDVDFTIDETDEKIDIEELSIQCVQDVLDARNAVAMQTLSTRDFIVLSAHTPKKLSLHIVSKKTYFKKNKLQLLFAQDVQKWLQSHQSVFTIDVSVYSNNRCFRMYKNHKYGKENPLVLFKPELYSFASFEDTWVVLTHQDLYNRREITLYNEEDIFLQKHVTTSEPMTQDLDEKLRAFLQEHSYLQLSGNNRLNRVDQSRRQCLTDPTDHHSTENMFWYISHHQLYVHCFCKKGTPICLGMRQGLFKKDIAPEKFHYATHSSADFETYDDFQQPILTIYDKRRTGKGKTTSAMNYMKRFRRVLLIHNRLTLDADYISKYPEFISYTKGINQEKQTVCFNSLGKIDVQRYDLVIIDEIRSVLKQTEMKDMMLSTHTLFNILENLKIPLIMLDANLTNRDIEFLRKYRPDPNAIIIHDDQLIPDKQVFMVHSKSEMAILSEINDSIERNEKIVIIYNRSIRDVNALLSMFEQRRRILHVNRMTRSSINMDTSTWYDDYDVIAYSPTISEGVSITDPRFANVRAFGLFTSTSCPAESASQMVARFRAITHYTIYVNTTNTRRTIPIFYTTQDVLNYMNNNIQHLHQINDAHLNVQREGKQLKIIEDEFCELYCKNLLEQSLDYHNYYDTLVQKLVNNGYEVFDDMTIQLPEEESAIVKEEVNALKEKEHQRIRQKIVESPNLSTTEFNTLIEAGVTNEEDECKVQKYNVYHNINIEPEYLTVETVKKYNNPNIRNTIKNIKNCFSFIRNERHELVRIPVDVLINEQSNKLYSSYESTTNFLEQKQYVTTFSITRMNWLNQRIQELGFQFLYSPEGIDLRLYEHNLQRMLDYFTDPQHYTHYSSSELLFGKAYSQELQLKLDKEFLMKKLNGIFALTIGIDKVQGKAYQQCTLDIRLHDDAKQFPNLLGHIHMPDTLVAKYDTMFMKGLVKYCDVCKTHFPHGITLKHYATKKHIKNATRPPPPNEELEQ